MEKELSELKDGAIGEFVYSPYTEAYSDIPAIEAFIHGWLCLNAQLHHDVWHQVLIGGYSACTIQLSVGPVEMQSEHGWRWDVAKNHILSITAASISFHRVLPKAVEATPEKRSSFWRK